MHNLFAYKTNQQLLEDEVMSWLNTPYRHMQCTKGRGTDCTLFIVDSLVKVGFMTGMTVPDYYPRDWFNVRDEEFLLNELEKNFNTHLREGLLSIIYTTPPVPMVGDICLFCLRSGIGVANHCGIVLRDSRMVHVTNDDYVRTTFYKGVWRQYQKYTFRLLEV